MSTITVTPLFAGDHGPVYASATIASGQDLAANSVLGIVTEGGAYTLCDKNSSDGSQTAKAVLPVAVDATAAAVVTSVVVHAIVDEDVLVFGENSDIEDHRAQLIAAGIYPVARQ